MKKNASKRPSSSPRGRKSKTSSGKTSTGRKMPKKKDNTKLFIGLGVGGVFFLFIIIAVAVSGSSSKAKYTKTTKKEFTLPISLRMKIYAEYDKKYDAIEDRAGKKMENLSLDERRKDGKRIRSQVAIQIRNMRIDVLKKYKNKNPDLSSSYMKKIINEGLDKNW